MKRFVAIILICLLAANVSGVAFVHHLCGKKSQYYSVTGKKKSSCCCGGTGKDKGCCKTKIIKVKLDEKQTLAKAFSVSKPILFDALQPALPIAVNHSVPLILFTPVQELAHPPPLLAASLRLHILYGVFLI